MHRGLLSHSHTFLSAAASYGILSRIKESKKVEVNGVSFIFNLELVLDSFELQRTFCRNQGMLNDSPFAILPGNHFKKILGWNSSGSRKEGRKLAFASHNSARLTYGLTAIFDFAQRVGYAGTSWHIPLKNDGKNAGA